MNPQSRKDSFKICSLLSLSTFFLNVLDVISATFLDFRTNKTVDKPQFFKKLLMPCTLEPEYDFDEITCPKVGKTFRWICAPYISFIF